MARNIKGITIELDGDTTKLSKALKNAEQSTKDVNKELKQVNNLLKFNPGNSELVAQKQKLLATQVENTSAKLKTLKDAQAQVEAQFKSGDLGEEEYRAFQREIVATEGKLNSYKGQLAQSKSSQKELANSAKQLGVLFTATGKDVDDFREVIGDKLADAIKNGTANAKQMKTAFSKIAQESGVAKSDVKALADTFDEFDGSDKSLKTITKSLDSLSGKSKTSSKVLGSFKEKLSFGAVAGLASNAIQSLTGGMGQLVSDAMSASDSMDKFKSTMKGAGFGKNEIDKAAKSMKTYADQTVYDTGTVMNTTAQLAANGIENYDQLTQAAGNMNAQFGGTQDTFQSVAQVMTQTAGAGKLTTENWNQMADAIPGASGKLQEAMKKNGAYTGNFRKAMEKGEISSDEFNDAVTDLGMNKGAVEAAKSTKTFEGAIGNLQANVVNGVQEIIDSLGKENLTNLISTIGDGLVGALDAVVKALKFVAEHKDVFKALAVGAGILFGVFKGVKAVNDVVDAFKKFNGITKIGTGIQAAFNAVMAINPFVLITIAIAAVVAALVWFFTQTEVGKKAWKSFSDFMSNIWKVISDTFTNVINAIGDFFKNAWQGMVDWLKPIWQGVSDWFKNLWNGIKNTFSSVLNAIKGVVTNVFNAVKNFISTVWNGIKSVITTVVNAIKGVIDRVWNGIKSLTSSVFNAVKGVVSNVWNGIKSVITTVVNAIKGVIDRVWNGIKSLTSSVFNGVKRTLSNIWNGIKTTITNAVNGIKSGITNAWDRIKSATSSVWNGIKGAIERPMNAAKNIVKAIIQKIKDLFNFKISWPHIPMPHFKISGSFNPLKGKIPKIGVDWYANGGIMTKPTMFANNGSNVSIGGEAGPEGVIPLNEKTLAAIGRGIAEASGSTGGTTINLTVYGELSTATARSWATTISNELERLRGRNGATGGGLI